MEFSILNLLLVLLVAWLAGLLATRLGYPSVLGELLAGIVLGPPLLGLLTGGPALAVLAEVGILLMMVYIGMEIDPKELGRASKAGFLAAIGGFITPFVLVYFAIIWAGGTVLAAIFVGIAAGVTSLATKSRILVDLKLLDTRIAHVMMAGALIADTLSLVIFAAVIGVAEAATVSAAGLAVVTGKAALFFAAAFALGMKVFPWLGARLRTFKTVGRTGHFTFVLLITLVFAEMAELAGLHGILGAFLAGLFMREGMFGRSLAKDLMHLVRDASIGFLAPIFFVTAGFAVSLDIFTESLGLLVLVVGLATVGKIAGTALFYLPTGHGWREGLTVGAGMNGRGAVEIIVAQIGLSLGLITQEIFSILVFMAIFTTATVPVFLKWGTDWLRRRGELVRSEHERDGVVIVGAGPTARALAKVLARSQPVRLIDRNREHLAFAQGDGLTAIDGNALDEEVLAQAEVAHARHFIALTPNAEVNALAARLARTVFYVPHIHVFHHGDAAGHAALVEHLGVTTLFGGPTDLGAWDYRVDHDRAVQTAFPVEKPMTAAVLFRSLAERKMGIPFALRRTDHYHPLHADTALEPGDRVLLLQEAHALPAALDRFDRLAARCPVLDLQRRTEMKDFFAIAAGMLAPELGIDPVVLTEQLRKREVVRSSVLLPGLAIPHVHVKGTGQFELLVARCREGIVFPDDPNGAHMVFVLIGSQDERTFHLRALSAIAQIVQRPDFERDWLEAPDADALRNLLLRAERRRMTEAVA